MSNEPKANVTFSAFEMFCLIDACRFTLLNATPYPGLEQSLNDSLFQLRMALRDLPSDYLFRVIDDLAERNMSQDSAKNLERNAVAERIARLVEPKILPQQKGDADEWSNHRVK